MRVIFHVFLNEKFICAIFIFLGPTFQEPTLKVLNNLFVVFRSVFRLSSICSKLNVCKNIPNPCSKLQCCSKLKSCSSCCKRKSRDVDVEKGLQGAADVTGSKRLKNFWRFMCCLNTACCLKLRDKCGCCKKLSCCKMGGCCGPLTQEEEVERQKRARMKTKRMSQQISQVPKVR
uniref:Uncharacterized protein n=1 Tax=Cacopsylla melanoneura TaxID=428564 RepID=A0A8D9B5I0_9HEMI